MRLDPGLCVAVVVLLEGQRMGFLHAAARETQARGKLVRLGNLVSRFKIGSAIDELEHFPAPIGTLGLHASAHPCGGRLNTVLAAAQPEPRRDAVFEHLEHDWPPERVDPANVLCAIRSPMCVAMPMVVPMVVPMVSATE